MSNPIIEGEPLQLGQVAVGTVYYATPVRKDGTRRVSELQFVDPGFLVNRYGRIEDGEVASEDQVGLIPTPRPPVGLFQESDLEEGIWMGFASPWVSRVPVTPGDDFYAFRNHVGQAADHFDSRFVPAKLNQRKATAHRLFEISGELSEEDRMKAGNVSLKERSDNGYLWRRIHVFRTMPFGTLETDTAWRAERDAIMALLHGHCDRCARIIDTALSHPHEEWKGYLDKEIRFHEAEDGSIDVIPNTNWLTPAVVTNDIANYDTAGKFFRTGAVDDDYLEPHSAPIPEPSGQATIPRFSGANGFLRTEMIAHWRKEIADLRASSRGSDFQKRMFYWFAASNILALYRDENNDAAGLGYLTLNRRSVRSTDVIEDSSLTTLGQALYRHYYPDLQSLSDTPWFMRARLFLAPANILITQPDNLLTIPADELDADGTWRADARAEWSVVLNETLGFAVLGATGPVEI